MDVPRHAIDVAAQDRRDISVDHCRVAPPDQLHQRAHFVRHRNLDEADFARQRGELVLVLRIAVAVEQHDGDRADAGAKCRLEPDPRAVEIERRKYLALGRQPLVHFDDALVQQLRQHDPPGEQLGAVLVGDTERIAKAVGDDQRHALALALEERVGGDRRSHLDRIDRRARERGPRGKAQQRANAMKRRIRVALGILRQKLVGDDRAVGALGHDVGEGAAAIDPELPAGRRGGGQRTHVGLRGNRS